MSCEVRPFSNDKEMLSYFKESRARSYRDASEIVRQLKHLNQHRLLKLRKELIRLDRQLIKQRDPGEGQHFIAQMKDIGTEIHDKGGMPLLRTIWHSIPGFNSVVELAWSGVGSWVY